jgi:hypothetical protein
MRACLLLALAALPLAACGSGHLGDGPPDQTVSPGTVTVRLLLPSGQSFCDEASGCGGVTHVSFGTETGQWLNVGASWCGVRCSDCLALPCPAIPVCIGQAGGVMITTVESTWDGSYVESSTCGNAVACTTPRFVRPGRYVARLCATPGEVTMTGAAPVCTATGSDACMDVPFDLPGATVVEAHLPDRPPAAASTAP